jgi:hypothetical protein
MDLEFFVLGSNIERSLIGFLLRIFVRVYALILIPTVARIFMVCITLFHWMCSPEHFVISLINLIFVHV